MWKKIEFAIVLLLLAVLIMMSNHLEEMVSSGRVTGRNPCIVLDSGHGGEDPGKIGVNQAKEKDVNLKIAKKTKERLEKKGWKVVMTREKDVMLGDPAAVSPPQVFPILKYIADIETGRCPMGGEEP